MFKTRWIGRCLAAVMTTLFTGAVAFSGGEPSPPYAKLPEAIANALKKKFPDETIAKEGVSRGDRFVWQVAVGKKGEKIVHIGTIHDGTVPIGSLGILSIQTPAKEADLPESAAKAIKTAYPTAKVIAVFRTEILAVPGPEHRTTYHSLSTPEIQFTIALAKEGEAKIQLASVDSAGKAGKWALFEPTKRWWWRASAVAGKDKLAIRVACGNDKGYTDLSGVIWAPDQKYSKENKWGWNGDNAKTAVREKYTVIETDAPELYMHERHDLDNYRFDVPNGKYIVRVHMCAPREGSSTPGQQSFGLKIQDKIVVPVSFDWVKEARKSNPYISWTRDVEVKDGKLIIEFLRNDKQRHPLVNAIEVIGQ